MNQGHAKRSHQQYVLSKHSASSMQRPPQNIGSTKVPNQATYEGGGKQMDMGGNTPEHFQPALQEEITRLRVQVEDVRL